MKIMDNFDDDLSLKQKEFVEPKDKATNKQQSITITGASNLQKDEVEKMVDEAEKNAEADKEKSKKIELKNNSEEKKIEILIDEKQVENNEIKIDFIFKNLISPYEALESPDSRKLGILVKNIKLVKI